MIFLTEDQWATEILKILSERGISNCLFDSIENLTSSVMQDPSRAICFKRRFWSVGLIGEFDWAIEIIVSSDDYKLYNAVSKILTLEIFHQFLIIYFTNLFYALVSK